MFAPAECPQDLLPKHRDFSEPRNRHWCGNTPELESVVESVNSYHFYTVFELSTTFFVSQPRSKAHSPRKWSEADNVSTPEIFAGTNSCHEAVFSFTRLDDSLGLRSTHSVYGSCVYVLATHLLFLESDHRNLLVF